MGSGGISRDRSSGDAAGPASLPVAAQPAAPSPAPLAAGSPILAPPAARAESPIRPAVAQAVIGAIAPASRVVPMSEPQRAPVDVLGRARADEARSLGGGAAVNLDDAERCWIVESGSVDIFALRGGEDGRSGVREFLFQVPKGGVLFGGGERSGAGIRLVAVGWEDSRLTPVDLSATVAAFDAASAKLLAPALDIWVGGLCEGVARHIALRVPAKSWLGPQDELTVAGEARLAGRKGVVWAHLTAGRVRIADIEEVSAEKDAMLVPLSPHLWLKAEGEVSLKGYSTAAFLQSPGWRKRLEAFHGIVLACLVYNFRNLLAKEEERLKERAVKGEGEKHGVLSRFASLLEEKGMRDEEWVGEAPLLQASALVAKALGVALKPRSLRGRKRAADRPLAIEDVARDSRLRVRQVALRGRWWREDNGPLVAFLDDGARPVALLQRSPRRYALHDPDSGKVMPVDEGVAAALSPIAYAFYPPFPDRKIGAWDLLAFGLRRCKRDLGAVLLTGAAGGLLGMATPLATALVFDAAIPGHGRGDLLQIGLALAVAAIGTVAFKITGDIATLRIEGRVGGLVQAAVLDRLLRLPTSFFGGHSSGDLAMRALTVETIRRALTGIVISSLLGGAFSLFSFALLFYYEPRAALVATVLFLLLAGVTVLAGYRQVKAIMEGETLAGNIYGLVPQILGGIAKLRLAGAEDRAFVRWGRIFGELRARMVRSRKVQNLFQAFSSGYEVLALAAVFAAVALARSGDLSTGTFLAFVAAFSTFLNASFQMARSTIQVFTVRPLYKRATPILEALPEVADDKEDPGRLSGALEVHQLAFRYGREGPRVLNGVSLRVKSGEFVAIVGPSGCGKSTLVKLLLGFETPEFGGVFYDGQDLRNLDPTAVRRQIGVVLQSGKLLPGSLYENIKGASGCPVEEAWEAAQLAGIAADIRGMPMGMHTVVTDGAPAFSGGQIQRILIARAMVVKPRLLIFDEATSALDNRTQAVVTESLSRLSVTRIVIAHRLSTVIDADRILVMSAGRVEESGSYAELMAKDGLFAALARRQIA